MKRPVLLVILLALAALAVWLVARGCEADAGDPVERLVADMVPIPGRDFRMGKYEVTQAQWEAVMGENPSEFKGANHPVENVSWDDCQAFLEKLNAHPATRASGLVFRLPTDEEWETACRAGSTNDFCRLADGTEITETTLGRVAWYVENAATRPRWLNRFLAFVERLIDRVYEVDWTETVTHHPVGRKEPNAWGLHDMHGNVWERTETAFGEYRVDRGGCWLDSAGYCESSNRGRSSPSDRFSILGFRLCATQSPAASESHAEPAENAEPRPGEAGPLLEGAAERSEAGGVSHAESAEWRPTPEQTGRFRFDDKGKVVVAEVDAEGRVRLLENGPDSPPLRIRPATIRNRNLFVVEMDDIPDTGRHWTLALDFDAAKRAWIVVGEGESIADIIPGKPGYRNATFHREDPPAPTSTANAPDPSRLPDEFVLVPAAVDSYTAVPPPPGLDPNWLYAVGIDHRDCFELVCTDREKKHFCTLGTRASIYSSFKLEWLDADTLLYTSGDIGTWAVFPTEEGRWNIRAATVRRNDSGAVESFELDYWLYPTNFTPQWPAIPALSATPSPAEKTHAENAEPEPHAEPAEGAEGLEGRAPSRPEEGSGEAEPSPSVAPPPAP